MSYTDVSIDLETLGVRPGSVITQIGLCGFNQRPPVSGGTASKSATLIVVDPQSMIDLGFFVDWSTIAWWLNAAEAPRVSMANRRTVMHEIGRALYRVGEWFANECAPNVRVWGHGCGFDCTQLEIAFQKLGMPVPWDFRRVRDLRTLADLAPAARVERPLPTMAHDAMADAVAQAEWIQRLTYQIERREVGVIQEQPQGPVGPNGVNLSGTDLQAV